MAAIKSNRALLAAATVALAATGAHAGLALTNYGTIYYSWPGAAANPDGTPASFIGTDPTIVTDELGPYDDSRTYVSNGVTAQNAVGQTFTTTDAFTLGAVAARLAGGASDTYSIHLFELNTNYVPRTDTDYVPANDVVGAGTGGGDLLGGGAGLQFTLNTPDALVEFRFTGADRVQLKANTTYSLEFWGVGTSTMYTVRTLDSGYLGGELLSNLTADANACIYNSPIARHRVGGGPREGIFAFYTGGFGTDTYWTGAGTNNNWTTAGNWADGAPNGVDAPANFGSITTGAYVVNVDQPRTVGTITFDSAVAYTLSGEAITMNASNGAPSIVAGIGSHLISSQLNLNNWLFVTVGTGAQLNLAGTLNVTASGRQLSKSGAGVLQIEQINTGSIVVNAGTLRVSAKGTPNSPSGTTVAENLVIDAAGVLDLTNNSMVIDYTGAIGTLADDVRQHLAAGRLTTSAAAPAGTKLGYADNAVLALSTFGGIAVESDDLLIKFTYAGDTNLDGQVDITDLGNLATAWQTNGSWIAGDSDYSGFIDITDLGALATNWQAGVGTPLGPSFSEALAAVGLGGVSVPEPAAMGVLGLIGVAALRRARRREI